MGDNNKILLSDVCFTWDTPTDKIYIGKITSKYNSKTANNFLRGCYIAIEDEIKKYLDNIDKLIAENLSETDFIKKITVLNDITPRVEL